MEGDSVLYPLNLELAGKSCVVVGGGQVAYRKVRGLLAAEAQVTVIAPMVTDDLRALAEAGRLKWLEQAFKAGLLKELRSNSQSQFSTNTLFGNLNIYAGFNFGNRHRKHKAKNK